MCDLLTDNIFFKIFRLSKKYIFISCATSTDLRLPTTLRILSKPYVYRFRNI